MSPRSGWLREGSVSRLGRLSITARITIGSLLVATLFGLVAVEVVRLGVASILHNATVTLLQNDVAAPAAALVNNPAGPFDLPGGGQELAIVDPSGAVLASTLPAALESDVDRLIAHGDAPHTVQVGDDQYLVLVASGQHARRRDARGRGPQQRDDRPHPRPPHHRAPDRCGRAGARVRRGLVAARAHRSAPGEQDAPAGGAHRRGPVDGSAHREPLRGRAGPARDDPQRPDPAAPRLRRPGAADGVGCEPRAPHAARRPAGAARARGARLRRRGCAPRRHPLVARHRPAARAARQQPARAVAHRGGSVARTDRLAHHDRRAGGCDRPGPPDRRQHRRRGRPDLDRLRLFAARASGRRRAWASRPPTSGASSTTCWGTRSPPSPGHAPTGRGCTPGRAPGRMRSRRTSARSRPSSWPTAARSR